MIFLGFSISIDPIPMIMILFLSFAIFKMIIINNCGIRISLFWEICLIFWFNYFLNNRRNCYLLNCLLKIFKHKIAVIIFQRLTEYWFSSLFVKVFLMWDICKFHFMRMFLEFFSFHWAHPHHCSFQTQKDNIWTIVDLWQLEFLLLLYCMGQSEEWM